MGIFDKSSSSSVSPYGPAKGPLDAALGRIGGMGANPWEVYGGEEVAGFTPQQIQALQRMGAFGGPGGAGAGTEELLRGTGGGLLGKYETGASSLEAGLGREPVEATRADLGYAGEIADNPFMSDMIDAAMRDVVRNFSEVQMPGIAGESANLGQLSSSRRGAYEAISERGAMDRGADIAASLRGGAYQTGLGMAEGAAGRQTASDLSNREADIRRAGGLMQAGGAGASMLGGAFDMGRMNIQDLLTSGNISQAQEQAIINAMKSKHYLGQELPYMQEERGMNLLMPSAGAFTKTTQESSANPVGALLGIGGQLAGSWLSGGGGNPFKGMFGDAQNPADTDPGASGGNAYGSWGGGGGVFDEQGTFGSSWDFGFPSVFDQVGGGDNIGGRDDEWWKTGF